MMARVFKVPQVGVELEEEEEIWSELDEVIQSVLRRERGDWC